MRTINYQIHLLLQSKYRLFYHLAIIFLIYFIFYGDKLIYCMMEDDVDLSDFPELVERSRKNKPAWAIEMEKVIQQRAAEKKLRGPIHLGTLNLPPIPKPSFDFETMSDNELFWMARHSTWLNGADLLRAEEVIQKRGGLIEIEEIDASFRNPNPYYEEKNDPVDESKMVHYVEPDYGNGSPIRSLESSKNISDTEKQL